MKTENDKNCAQYKFHVYLITMPVVLNLSSPVGTKVCLYFISKIFLIAWYRHYGAPYSCLLFRFMPATVSLLIRDPMYGPRIAKLFCPSVMDPI